MNQPEATVLVEEVNASSSNNLNILSFVQQAKGVFNKEMWKEVM